ncbi:CAP domain-containing protein [Pacificibacter marinus]|uniref:CAP domain-containing protein n=1 Tax=Pacificibacter marinus TaxID=658057 RepID=UPI001C07CCA3|nr:CAP domain-containing protein [Pacificibacter marinus]MBU2868878.1 CAP domain-containing protein [Pacificibacter marinus]
MLKKTLMGLCAALSLTACQSQTGVGFAQPVPVQVGGVNTAVAAEGEVLAAVNAERASYGLQPLVYNGLLTRAARAHVEDMVRTGIFSHTGSNGGTAADRARHVGYQYCIVGENISMGHASIQAAVQGWMASKGHRDNILNRRFNEIGIGIGEGGRYVTDFGSRC